MENIEVGSSGLQPARLRRTPSWLITQTATLVNRLISAALTEAGATRYQYAVLAALEEFGPTSQAELGRRCHIDRSDVVATINDLVHGRYVERRRDPDDRRQNLINLTEDGQQRLQHIARVLEGVQNDLLGHLSEDERDKLTTTLRRILDHQADGPNAPQ